MAYFYFKKFLAKFLAMVYYNTIRKEYNYDP